MSNKSKKRSSAAKLASFLDTIDLSSDTRSSRSSSVISDISAITISSTDSGVAAQTPKDRLNFVFRSYVQTKGKQILWSIEFNNYLKPGEPKIFATIGGRQILIFECQPNGQIKSQFCFEDPDRNENFYTCCWSLCETTNQSILLAAGERGVIQILYPEHEEPEETVKHLIGHGASVNQLKISRKHRFLLASASSDHSIRLWNIQTNVCIATFHGENGHRDHVVTIDFNRDSSKLVSGGIDHMLAIWDLAKPEIMESIEKSKRYNENGDRSFKTVLNSFPIFRSRGIHCNYIDSVQWFNNFILSKSTENDFYCSIPGGLSANSKSSDFFRLIDFKVANCDYYWLRFAANFDLSLVALGNTVGQVRIWDLNTDDHTNLLYKNLSHPKRKTFVRDISFSRCGNHMVFCCEDGTIWYHRRG